MVTTEGGNFKSFTNDWVVSASILSLTGQTGKQKMLAKKKTG